MSGADRGHRAGASAGPPPSDPLVGPLLTDLYQITMAYAYWRSGRHELRATFDLFFRHAPFGGTFAVCAGLEEALRLVDHWRFDAAALDAVRELVPHAEPAFFDWLAGLDAGGLTIHAVPEGTIVFPRTPLLRVEGPLAPCQLLETTLLNLVNFPTLVATKAARMRLAAGPDAKLIEFGLRRAQGPDGSLSAARYAVLGGFDGTSHVLAGRMFGLDVRGTHAHSYVQSFAGLDDLPETARGEFLERVLHFRGELGAERSHEGELASFVAYARSFPDGFLALVDTYHTLESGVPNFLAVALALDEAGHRPVGVRLDSGDLAFLSRETRRMFDEAGRRFGCRFGDLSILASNEIDENVIRALGQEGHAVDAFGVGTKLATCASDPALGGVYKLVALDGRPRIKISDDTDKVTIPGRKRLWRLRGEDRTPILDLMTVEDEPPPWPGREVVCIRPFDSVRRARVTPAEVQPLLEPVWEGRRCAAVRPLDAIRERVLAQLGELRRDHLRALNPTPYKVSVSQRLNDEAERLLRDAAPERRIE